MNILLVHGIFDSGRVFKTLRRALVDAGHHCYAPDLKPADARLGLPDLAEKLFEFIRQNPDCRQPLVIIGFSMGCLVSRYFLQQLQGHQHCLAFLAIAGPHQGSLLAYAYLGQGARDMRPNSQLLVELKAGESCLSGLALFAYHTPYDLMILPPDSAYWPIAQNLAIPSLLHRLLVSDKRLIADILHRLQQIEVDLAKYK